MNQSVESLNAEAIHLAERGEYKDAITCLKCAIQIEKQNYILWLNLGITYRDAGRLHEAQSALEKALQLKPEDITTLETLAIVCNSLADSANAYKYASIAVQRAPDNSHVWNTIGVIYFSETDYESACNAFENAVILDPYYYDALYNLRDTYDELGNKAGKEECIKKMKEIERNQRGR